MIRAKETYVSDDQTIVAVRHESGEFSFYVTAEMDILVDGRQTVPMTKVVGVSKRINALVQELFKARV